MRIRVKYLNQADATDPDNLFRALIIDVGVWRFAPKWPTLKFFFRKA